MGSKQVASYNRTHREWVALVIGTVAVAFVACYGIAFVAHRIAVGVNRADLISGNVPDLGMRGGLVASCVVACVVGIGVGSSMRPRLVNRTTPSGDSSGPGRGRVWNGAPAAVDGGAAVPAEGPVN